ncbi:MULTISPECIES: amidase [Nonomuraea]|uniref:Amidase n=1 Tax=Nonomuraea ferruginea TaxID=46174 RepID=A0ABT4TA99_9ACTN|nr:amidase [Nonomuraea ferruginea]MDA0646441.1 amidase [Nonomuraea ferruginea]
MTTSSGPFAGRTIDDLGRDLRAGRTTAEELTREALDAITRLDPVLNAFVSVDQDGALAAAREADAELAGGADRGPLHGLPVGVKDLLLVAGMPATMGSRHFAGYVPDTDAACVTRLREAGAVIVGKTTTQEFAYGPTGDCSANGASRNPWDPARMSGGSSGGSGAAVAAGLVPLAIGTDTGGSVRIPAALCGVAGLKPAYGAIPADGAFPLSPSLDHVGVLARTAGECFLAYRLLSGRDAVESGSVTPRVAWLDPSDLHPCDPEVVRVAAGAAGAKERVALPPGAAEAFMDVYVTIGGAEAAEVHAERVAEAPELFQPEVLDRLRGAMRVPGWKYVRATAERRRLAGVAEKLFEDHDVLALPTVPLTAPPLGLRETVLDGRPVGVRAALLALTSPWNVLGFPALSVPAGLAGGLPVGLQLVCRPGDEHLLAAAVPTT